MRTTLELDDQLHALARRRAFEQRRSLGDVVSELALRGLEHERDARVVRTLDRFAGLIHVSDDFNEMPEEIREAVDRALS